MKAGAGKKKGGWLPPPNSDCESMFAVLLPALVGYHLGARGPSARAAVRCTAARCVATATGAETSTQIQYGGIPHVAVIVGDGKEALKYYTEVLGMTDVTDSEAMDVPGACVRVGEQTIQLMELATPDPFDVDPTYSMSAPPPGYVCKGRPVHAGRDRHVALTLHALAPLKASLEANGVNYTMSYSGRQALPQLSHVAGLGSASHRTSGLRLCCGGAP